MVFINVTCRWLGALPAAGSAGEKVVRETPRRPPSRPFRRTPKNPPQAANATPCAHGIRRPRKAYAYAQA